jgi:TolB-like protein/DNA-binding winged helix-turn-helix (wHTH) protein/Tfp pilus assembly protein PilF
MQERIYRFAEFELNSGEGLLRANDSVIRLQDKPLRLLCALLDHPQRLVTREQLRQRMWDTRTIVDYEQGINVAAKKVRDALGDSAENPRFMETVAKKGYRLLVPVTMAPPHDERRAIAAPQPLASNPTVLEPLAANPDSSAGSSVSAKQAVSRRWLFPAVAAAISCVLGLAFFTFQRRPQHSVGIHSLAVLPLQDLSPGTGQEYFADGITEELTTSLARTLPLRVISSASVMRFKRTNEPITQIARELGVEAIVEGAVARSGNRVSVTVQLIDATEDRHIWAQRYERSTDDILEMEDDLSQNIASQIGGTLSLQTVKPANSHQVDPQVYELCLLGRYHWNKRTVADFLKAEAYFQQAIARDRNHAPAYAGLADVYALWPSYGSVASLESYAKAEAAAQRALELDDTLAEAHATLGFLGLARTIPDWRQTGAELRRALQLNPSYATAHRWFAYYLFFTGRREEAVAEMELAQRLDPLSAIANADDGQFLYIARRFDEARARLREAIELEPELGQPHATLALIELETGHAADALREARAGLALDPNNQRTFGEAGYVLAATGETAAAKRLLIMLEDLDRRGATAQAYVAMVEIGLGQGDQALDALQAWVHLGGRPFALGQWHVFDSLSTNPRYQKLLAQAR